MQIHSLMPMSFGKIYVIMNPEQKELLYKHAAYGISDGSAKRFAEKYRLANLSDRYVIRIDENGADVLDKNTHSSTSFNVQDIGDYPNALFHVLNIAMNYVLLKNHKIFETEDITK